MYIVQCTCTYIKIQKTSSPAKDLHLHCTFLLLSRVRKSFENALVHSDKHVRQAFSKTYLSEDVINLPEIFHILDPLAIRKYLICICIRHPSFNLSALDQSRQVLLRLMYMFIVNMPTSKEDRDFLLFSMLSM